MIEVLPYDLHESRITYAEAARLAAVSVNVVWNWASRGYRGTDGQWHRLTVYETTEGKRLQPIQVLQAEAATRSRALRPGRRRVILTPTPNA